MISSKSTHKGLVFSGSNIITAYILNKSTGFILSFILTLLFNYPGSLSNELTNEFLPGVKDVIAGFYPNKAIFQISIALGSFLHVVFSAILFGSFRTQSRDFANIAGLLSIFRLVSLLCFSYITSKDDISAFNNSYVLYLISNLGWIYFIESRVKSRSGKVNQVRRQIKIVYFGCLIAATFFFYKHQLEKTSYAYSISSLFQWNMVGLDIFFDYTFTQEIKSISISIDFPDGNLKKHLV